jgi:hypothetical protein
VRYLSSAGVALLAEAAALAPALSIVVAGGSSARVCALTGVASAVPLQEAPEPHPEIPTSGTVVG